MSLFDIRRAGLLASTGIALMAAGAVARALVRHHRHGADAGRRDEVGKRFRFGGFRRFFAVPVEERAERLRDQAACGWGSATLRTITSRRGSSSFAIKPVQPVCCEAPSPRPCHRRSTRGRGACRSRPGRSRR